MNWFQSQSVVLQAFLTGCLWGCMLSGQLSSFLQILVTRVLDIVVGFAAGAMFCSGRSPRFPDSSTVLLRSPWLALSL